MIPIVVNDWIGQYMSTSLSELLLCIFDISVPLILTYMHSDMDWGKPKLAQTLKCIIGISKYVTLRNAT